MAKAKKPEAAGATAAGKTSKKAAGGKAAGKAGGAKKSAAPAAAGPAHAPQIDTSLAASAAAAMILNRAVTGGAGGAGGSGAAAPPRAESAGFKHLKQGLNQPAGGGLGGLLGGAGQPKKSNQNYGGGKQVGRNQTFGADVNRAGVPRRTGGG